MEDSPQSGRRATERRDDDKAVLPADVETVVQDIEDEEEEEGSTLSLPSPFLQPRKSDRMRRRAALPQEDDSSAAPVVPRFAELELDLNNNNNNNNKDGKDGKDDKKNINGRGGRGNGGNGGKQRETMHQTEDLARRRQGGGRAAVGRSRSLQVPPRALPPLIEPPTGLRRTEIVHVRARDIEMRLEGDMLAQEVSRLLGDAVGHERGTTILTDGSLRVASPSMSRATSRAASPTRWLDRNRRHERAASTGGSSFHSSAPNSGADTPPGSVYEYDESIDIERLLRLPNDEMLQAMGTLMSNRFTGHSDASAFNSGGSSGDDQRLGPIPSLPRKKSTNGTSDDFVRELSSDNVDKIGDSYIMRGFKRRSRILGATTHADHVAGASSAPAAPPIDVVPSGDVMSSLSVLRTAKSAAHSTGGAGSETNGGIYEHLFDKIFSLLVSRLRSALLLRFTPEHEHSYKQHQREESLSQWRVTVFLFFIFTTLAFVIEPTLIAGTEHSERTIVRVLGSAHLFVLFLALFTGIGKRHGNLIVTWAAMIAGVTAVVIAVLTNQNQVPHEVLLWTVLAFMANPVIAAPMIVLGMLLLLTYATLYLWLVGSSVTDFIVDFITFAGLLVVGAVRIYMSDLQARQNYVLRDELIVLVDAITKVKSFRHRTLIRSLPSNLAKERLLAMSTLGSIGAKRPDVIVLKAQCNATAPALSRSQLWNAFDTICDGFEGRVHVIRTGRADVPYTIIADDRAELTAMLMIASRMLSAATSLNANARIEGSATLELSVAVSIGPACLVGIETFASLALFSWGQVMDEVDGMLECLVAEKASVRLPGEVRCCVSAALSPSVPEMFETAPVSLIDDPAVDIFRVRSCTTWLLGLKTVSAVQNVDVGDATEAEAPTWTPPVYDVSNFWRLCNWKMQFRGELETDFQLYLIGDWFYPQCALMALQLLMFVFGMLLDLSLEDADGSFRVNLAMVRLTVCTPLMCMIGTLVWWKGVCPLTEDGLSPRVFHLLVTTFFLIPILFLIVVTELLVGTQSSLKYSTSAIASLVSFAGTPMVRLVDALVAATIVLIAESISFGLRSEWSVHYLWIPAVVFACGFVAFAVDKENRVRYLWCLWTQFALLKLAALRGNSQRLLNMTRPVVSVDQGVVPNVPVAPIELLFSSDDPLLLSTRTRRYATMATLNTLSQSMLSLSNPSSGCNSVLSFDSTIWVEPNFAILTVDIQPNAGTCAGQDEDRKAIADSLTRFIGAIEILGATYNLTVLPSVGGTMRLLSRGGGGGSKLRDAMFDVLECAIAIRDIDLLARAPARMNLLLHIGCCDLSEPELDTATMVHVYEADDILKEILEEQPEREARTSFGLSNVLPPLKRNGAPRLRSNSDLSSRKASKPLPSNASKTIFLSDDFHANLGSLEQLFLFGKDSLSKRTVVFAGRMQAAVVPYEKLLADTISIVDKFLHFQQTDLFITPTFHDFGLVLKAGSGLKPITDKLNFQAGLGQAEQL